MSAICAACGHRHTTDGCTGEPTPSDLWAGVSPAACDCLDNVHHIERPEDYLSPGELRFLADEKAEEAAPHCATCRCGEGLL